MFLELKLILEFKVLNVNFWRYSKISLLKGRLFKAEGKGKEDKEGKKEKTADGFFSLFWVIPSTLMENSFHFHNVLVKDLSLHLKPFARCTVRSERSWLEKFPGCEWVLKESITLTRPLQMITYFFHSNIYWFLSLCRAAGNLYGLLYKLEKAWMSRQTGSKKMLPWADCLERGVSPGRPVGKRRPLWVATAPWRLAPRGHTGGQAKWGLGFCPKWPLQWTSLCVCVCV